MLAACLLLAGAAWAQRVDLAPGQQVTRLDDDLEYWASIGPVPGPAYQAFREGAFSKAPDTVTPGFGHAPEMWFAVEVRNDSFDDGRAGDTFVVTYDAVTVMGFRLFLVREDGLTENLSDYSAYFDFSPDQWAVNRLRSAAFLLAPGEQVTLLAHVQLGPAPLASVSVMNADALGPAGVRWAASLVGFYAFSISCILLGLGFLIAMRSYLGLVYLFLLFGFLWQLAYTDMLIFRFLSPGTPSVHAALGYATFFLIASVIALVASVGLRREPVARPLAAWVFLGLAGLSLVLMVLMFLVESEVFLLIAFAIIAVSLTANLFIPVDIYQREDNPGHGFRMLFGCVAATSIFSMAWCFWGWGMDGIGVRLPLKVSYTVLLLSVVTFFTVNLTALRRRHMDAVAARIAALELEAEKSRQLLETERAYRRASEAASLNQRKLATASHDIKQPLMSLRTTFDAMSSDMDQGVTKRLQEAFSYLETLSKSYVDGTVPAQTAPSPDEAPAEAYALSVPLGTVLQMFEGEAAAKGLRLRVVTSSLETTAAPMVLMRILTNLVSNAIKYTGSGGVLVGVRRDGSAIWVCDTGRGMTDTEIAQNFQPYHKGDGSQGHGLGLSVCAELAKANDLALTVQSVPGRGTVFRLSLENHLAARG